MIDLSQAHRELLALNRRRAEILAAHVPSPASAEPHQGLALAVGRRVLDLVTGEEGVIIDGTVEHIIVTTAGQ